MFFEQISIFVENKPGRLAKITRILADNGVDIRALSIADTADYGILRLIVNKPREALALLKGEGVTVSLTEVIAVAVDDTPGALASVVEGLSKDGIGIEYMYAFLSPDPGTACVILRVEDNERAAEKLKANGVRLMNPTAMYGG